MKLFKQKSSILPDLKFKKFIQYDENQKTTRLCYKPKVLLIKDSKNSESSNNNDINKEKKELIYLRNDSGNKKRSNSNRLLNNNNNNIQKNINELKEEIESLKNQLNDEKLKSEVLKEIAEEEQKKHLLYKKKFQTIVLSRGELISYILDPLSN